MELSSAPPLFELVTMIPISGHSHVHCEHCILGRRRTSQSQTGNNSVSEISIACVIVPAFERSVILCGCLDFLE